MLRLRPQSLPVGDRGFKNSPARGERTLALRDVIDRHVVRRDQPGTRPRLDRHVADRHPPFHRQSLDRRPVIFDRMPGRAPGANLADDRQNDVLRLEPRAKAPGHLDSKRCRPKSLPERLRRQNMLNLTRADSKRQRTECSVCARMAVPANNSHSWKRQPQLRPDHVHDPLPPARNVVKRDSELRAVGPHRLHLPPRQRVGNLNLLICRYVVIDRGEC